MRLTQEHCARIAHGFPKHRGSLTYGNFEVLNAILYIAENRVQMPQPAQGVRALPHRLREDARLSPTGRAGPRL